MHGRAGAGKSTPVKAGQQHNVMALLDGHLRRNPDAIALRWVEPEVAAAHDGISALQHQRISWAELDVRVRRAAAGLAERGFTAGDRALIFVPMSVDLYVAMFSVFRLGGVAVFLDSFARQHQLAACAQLAAPKAYFGNQEAHGIRMMLADVLGGIPIQVVTGGLDAPGAVRIDEVEAVGREVADLQADAPATAAVVPDTTALVTFTTGSSGAPKGANRTHGFLFAQHQALDRHVPYEPGDADLPAFPIFLLNNMAAGITTVIPAIDLARPADSDAARVVSQLRHERLQCATFSPALLGRWARHAVTTDQPLTDLRRVLTGGAPVGPGLVRDFQAAAPQAELLILYGSTEAEPIAHITGADSLARLEGAEGVCVGEVVPELKRRLVRLTKGPLQVDDGGWSEWDVPAGEPGELLVAGEHVCRAYWRNDEAFDRAKVRDPDGDTVWHRTGDVGRIDERGRLWLVGRVHNAVLRAGRHHFPVGPEEVLRGVPGLTHGAYVGMPDDNLGERAAVAYSADTDLTQRVKDALDHAGVVYDEVRRVDRIPMDPRHHSKVDYDRLRDLLAL